MKKKREPLRCLGYARSAVAPGTPDGRDPIAEQVAEIKRGCRRWRLLDVLHDPGRSAHDLGRPGLRKLLGRVRRGGVDAVVVARLTALARSPERFETLLGRFERRGVRLISLAEGIDTGRRAGKDQVDALRWASRERRAPDAGPKTRTA